MATYSWRTITSTRREWIVPAAQPWGAFLGDIEAAVAVASLAYREAHGLGEHVTLTDDALRFHVGDDLWQPTRPVAAHRRTGRAALTPEQQALAEDIHTRALALRAASEDGLSIREAVALAAVQLGLEPPHTAPERTGD